eukprot:8528218-Alexandrium_andersonii.AAC.1
MASGTRRCRPSPWCSGPPPRECVNGHAHYTRASEHMGNRARGGHMCTTDTCVGGQRACRKRSGMCTHAPTRACVRG